MYSLTQAGRLAYIKPIKHLSADGYIPTGQTPGLLRHITRPATFNLVLDNVVVKVIGQAHADHLINIPKKNYYGTIDRYGKIFCVIHFK